MSVESVNLAVLSLDPSACLLACEMAPLAITEVQRHNEYCPTVAYLVSREWMDTAIRIRDEATTKPSHTGCQP